MAFTTPATVEDAVFIASRLREADRRECDALLALPPEQVLPQAVAAGQRVWTLHTAAGEPVGLYGVNPVEGLPQVGTIWAVGTTGVTGSRDLIVAAAACVDALNDEYPVLTNLMDARNTLHQRWLRRLGFVFLRRIESWGARGVPFIEFARLKPCASH